MQSTLDILASLAKTPKLPFPLEDDSLLSILDDSSSSGLDSDSDDWEAFSQANIKVRLPIAKTTQYTTTEKQDLACQRPRDSGGKFLPKENKEIAKNCLNRR